MCETYWQIVGVVALLGERRFGARVRKVCGEAMGPTCVHKRPAGAPDQNTQVDAERVEFVVALGDDVEQACALIGDRRGRTRAILMGIDAGIGKERCRLMPARVGEQLRTTAA